MKLLILCDRKSEETGLRKTLEEILNDNQTEVLGLDYQQFRPCIGCFGCWLKSPGTCLFNDDPANELCAKEVNCDAVILLSEVTYGGYSADIKAFLDRTISNILPYFEIYRQEMHHKKRYARFPNLFSIGYGDWTEEEKTIFTELNKRNAWNMQCVNYGVVTVKDNRELLEAAPEIHALLRGEN